jgi:hypothetical protein
LSALVWELETNAEAVFGASPFNTVAPTPSTALAGKRLYRAMERLRTRRLPAVIASMNVSKTTFVRRFESVDASDPLAVTQINTTEDVYAYIYGPSDQNLAKDYLSVSDFEVVCAANDLSAPLTEKDAVRIDGRDHDIIGIIPYPQHPSPIAYRFLVKRAA